MKNYQYRSLRDGEIRCLTLKPGEFDDDLRINLAHMPLVDPPKEPSPRVSVKELQKSLPDRFKVYKTFKGRYIFVKELENYEHETSWRHPDMNFDPWLFELPHRAQSFVLQSGFEALSYVWGPQDQKEVLYVEGESDFATLEVGPNLASALRHLRYSDRPRTLWIDAIW